MKQDDGLNSNISSDTTSAVRGNVTTQPSLIFHPDFSTPAPNSHLPVILKTSDEINFHVDLAILSEHSSFFATLASLPSPTPKANNAQDNVIPLPSATSTGLHLILSVLHPNTNQDFLVSLTLSEDPPFSLLEQALDVADVYDFPSFPMLLAIHFEDHPFMQFALAALADDENMARSASRMTITGSMSDLPSCAEKLLGIYAPGYLHRLQDLHTLREHAYRKAIHSLKFEGQVYNGINDFTKKCLKHGGCLGYRSVRGRFKHLRMKAADAVIHDLASKSSGSANRIDAECVRQVAACRICTTRLTRTFTRAMMSYWYNTRTTI